MGRPSPCECINLCPTCSCFGVPDTLHATTPCGTFPLTRNPNWAGINIQNNGYWTGNIGCAGVSFGLAFGCVQCTQNYFCFPCGVDTGFVSSCSKIGSKYLFGAEATLQCTGNTEFTGVAWCGCAVSVSCHPFVVQFLLLEVDNPNNCYDLGLHNGMVVTITA